MKKILVTGASGQLGKSIRDWAVDFPTLQFHFEDRAGMDITMIDVVSNAFSKFKPDYCINCAAYTKVDQAELTPEPAYEINVEGVKNLVQASLKQGTILIHISTDYVFDGTKKEGYFPNDKPNPLNVYGLTKWKGEEIIRSSMERFFIIRTSWLYSKKYAPNFYLTILDKAKRGEDLMVTDAERGCPTDASNLARHILTLIDSRSKAYGVSHFTDGEAMSWHEFATKILQEHGILQTAKLDKGQKSRSFAQRPKRSILF